MNTNNERKELESKVEMVEAWVMCLITHAMNRNNFTNAALKQARETMVTDMLAEKDKDV